MLAHSIQSLSPPPSLPPSPLPLPPLFPSSANAVHSTQSLPPPSLPPSPSPLCFLPVPMLHTLFSLFLSPPSLPPSPSPLCFLLVPMLHTLFSLSLSPPHPSLPPPSPLPPLFPSSANAAHSIQSLSLFFRPFLLLPFVSRSKTSLNVNHQNYCQYIIPILMTTIVKA